MYVGGVLTNDVKVKNSDNSFEVVRPKGTQDLDLTAPQFNDGSNWLRVIDPTQAVVAPAEPRYFSTDWWASGVKTEIEQGQLVRLHDDIGGGEEGEIYRYIGKAKKVEIDLSSTPYADTDLWELAAYSVFGVQNYEDSRFWKRVDLVQQAAEVQAFVLNSGIHAEGDLIQTATSDNSVGAIVASGSAAIAGGMLGGVAGAGAGANANNAVAIKVHSSIDGDGETGIDVRSISLNAEDNSEIEAKLYAVSVAVAIGVGVGAGSFGGSFTTNVIANDVQTYISNADDVQSGDVSLTSTQSTSIAAYTLAVSTAIALGKGAGLSGAGTGATNVIGNTVASAIRGNSEIDSTGDVSLLASDASSIDADLPTVSIAGGVAVVAGAVSVSRNTISTTVDATIEHAIVQAQNI